MNELRMLIEQMVLDISSQTVRLDGLRLHLFINWLNAHSSRVKANTGSGEQSLEMDIADNGEESINERIETGLRAWFATLPLQGLLWEYHLILDEIAWWQDLDPGRLVIILGSEERQ